MLDACSRIEQSMRGNCSHQDLLADFFLNRMRFDLSDRDEPMIEKECGRYLFGVIGRADPSLILDIVLAQSPEDLTVATKDIPQFSSIDGIISTVDVMSRIENVRITYKELGYYLGGSSKSSGANQKFGENQFKLAEELGLVSIVDSNKFANALGKSFRELGDKGVEGRLALRVPFIQYALCRGKTEKVRLIDLLEERLSVTTARRRRSSVENLVNLIFDLYDPTVNNYLNSIDWRSLR